MDLSKLKEYRVKQKMTQVQVAAKVGVSLMAYRLWEMGVGKPNRENYDKLMEALKILPFVEE